AGGAESAHRPGSGSGGWTKLRGQSTRPCDSAQADWVDFQAVRVRGSVQLITGRNPTDGAQRCEYERSKSHRCEPQQPEAEQRPGDLYTVDHTARRANDLYLRQRADLFAARFRQQVFRGRAGRGGVVPVTE